MGNETTYFMAGAAIALIGATALHVFRTKAPRMSGSHVLLSPQDYIEIQQLYSMYARAVDPGSVKDASWMFTADAVVVMDDFKTITGRDDIKIFYTGVQNSQTAGMRHFNTSYVIVGMPDGSARGSSYMMCLEKKSEDGPIEVTNFGKYEDRLVKTRDGWRIKERVWRADKCRASTAFVTASPLPGDPTTYTTGAAEAIKAASQ